MDRILVFWNNKGVLDDQDFPTLEEAVSYVEDQNGVVWDSERVNCTFNEDAQPASFRQGGKVIAAWSLENGLRTLDQVLARLKKLLDTTRYAENGEGRVSEAEVELATNRAQALLAEFNVDAATIDALHDPRIPVEERRIKHECAKPLTYEWQDRLWNTLAYCNFCLHYKRHVIKDVQVTDPDRWDWDNDCPRKKWVMKVTGKRHELIGRESNVLAVETLGNYIEDAILRMCPYPVTHKLANSWKLGCSERIRERLLAKRKHMEDEVRPVGPSSSTAIALASVFKSEQDKNIDTLYGEGTAARWEAERREAEEKQALAEERRQMIQDCPDAFSAEEYQEAVKEVARLRKAEEKRAKTRERASNSYWDGVNISAWYDGQRAGEKIGLDPQIRDTNATMIEE